jgi:hypothetical protein
MAVRQFGISCHHSLTRKLARSMLGPSRFSSYGGSVRKIVRFFAIVMMSSAAIAAGAGLPPKVADRLEHAVSFDDTEDFVGTYRITISSVVQKPNGKSRKESHIEADVSRLGAGFTQRRLLKYIENGSDVTEEKRTDFEGEEGGRPNKKADDDGDQELADPFGSTADHYRFGAPESQGSTVVMAFEPAPDHENDEDIAQGTIAWDAESLDPRWLEIEAVHPPKPLKELRLRMEFEHVDDSVFVSRLETDGLAKILLLKREFHVDISFDDIRPAEQNGALVQGP